MCLATSADNRNSTETRFDFWATVTSNCSPYATGPLSCLSVCLSVRLVYYGQTVGWIKMPLGVAIGLGPGDIVLDGLPHGKGHSSPTRFSAHVYCGQTVTHLSNC